MENPVVSVCMITYNHESYICEAIEGVLMQKTSFPIELIIGEDCSTDNTRKIVREYEERYPEIIKAQYPEKNRGMINNFLTVLQSASGKYIAYCEGDDYWTDPFKLQKQVDFLEENKKYSFCCHRYNRLYVESNEFKNDLHEELFSDRRVLEINSALFARYWLTQPLTTVFRKEAINEALINIPKYNYFRDIHIFYEILKKSEGCSLNFFGGVYRIHSGGIKSGDIIDNQLEKTFEILKEIYSNEQTETIRLKLVLCTFALIKNKKNILPLFKLFSLSHSTKDFLQLNSRLIRELIKKMRND